MRGSLEGAHGTFAARISSAFVLLPPPPPFSLLRPDRMRGRRPYLRLPTVTLLSFLDVPVATLAAAGGLPDVGQVEEAHAHALLQAGLQVLPAAAAEQHGEGVPAEETPDRQSPGRDAAPPDPGCDAGSPPATSAPGPVLHGSVRRERIFRWFSNRQVWTVIVLCETIRRNVNSQDPQLVTRTGHMLMSSPETEKKKKVQVAMPSRSRAPCTQPPERPGPADAGIRVCDGHATVSPKHSYRRMGVAQQCQGYEGCGRAGRPPGKVRVPPSSVQRGLPCGPDSPQRGNVEPQSVTWRGDTPLVREAPEIGVCLPQQLALPDAYRVPLFFTNAFPHVLRQQDYKRRACQKPRSCII